TKPRTYPESVDSPQAGLRNAARASTTGDSLTGLDVYGVVDYWTYGLFGWTQVNPDDQRDRARVRFDHANLGKLDSNGTTYAFSHEFGHAVGLKHNNSGVSSVMRDTSIVWEDNKPQQADKEHIKEKYGN
ncbi:hypothetical protein NLX71_26460, partial [Paenibacillus sp. MZ04-78.2]|nr:hypothetical protein [Paenibacillus sp. MZ04-78.2]